MHSPREIGLGRAKEQVEVVGHQNECEELPTSGDHRAFQDVHPLLSIVVVEDNIWRPFPRAMT